MPSRRGRTGPRWRGVVLLVLAALLVTAGLVRPTAASADAAEDLPVLELFWAEGCPYCAAERAWLPQLQAEVPGLVVRAYEITGDEANGVLLDRRAAQLGVRVRAVPATFFDEQHWVGFNEAIAEQIEGAVRAAAVDLPAPEQPSAVVAVPLVGPVDLGGRSLVAATVLIGALDGVNPCSLWVLSLLLALVLHTGSRRRVFAVGTTFLVITAAMYALYVGGLYGALSYMAYTPWIRVVLALVAGGFGAVAVKDYFWLGRGMSLSIPEHRKPGIYRRMRRIAATDRPLGAVLGGTALMAVGVSLVETPCTAGFPIVWTNLLSAQGVGGATAGALFALYMLVFLLDEVVVFTAAVVTMRAAKLQERHGRLLKLVSGVVMLTLAVTMLLAPELLEDLAGTLVVFGTAAAVTTLIAVTRSHSPSVTDHAPPRSRRGRA